MLLKVEKRSTEVATVMTERATLQSFLREKDQMIESLKKTCDSLKADLGNSEQGRADLIRRLQEEQREAQTRERKEKSKLQREVETLTRQVEEANQSIKEKMVAVQAETDRAYHENRVLKEESRLIA